jgi:hypothetical protein
MALAGQPFDLVVLVVQGVAVEGISRARLDTYQGVQQPLRGRMQ